MLDFGDARKRASPVVLLPGESVSRVLSMHNTAPATFENVRVRIVGALPSGVTLATRLGRCGQVHALPNGEREWLVPTLAAGQRCTLTTTLSAEFGRRCLPRDVAVVEASLESVDSVRLVNVQPARTSVLVGTGELPATLQLTVQQRDGLCESEASSSSSSSSAVLCKHITVTVHNGGKTTAGDVRVHVNFAEAHGSPPHHRALHWDRVEPGKSSTSTFVVGNAHKLRVSAEIVTARVCCADASTTCELTPDFSGQSVLKV